MNGVYGGGFNIKAIISKNQSVECTSKEFLSTFLYKK